MLACELRVQVRATPPHAHDRSLCHVALHGRALPGIDALRARARWRMHQNLCRDKDFKIKERDVVVEQLHVSWHSRACNPALSLHGQKRKERSASSPAATNVHQKPVIWPIIFCQKMNALREQGRFLSMGVLSFVPPM